MEHAQCDLSTANAIAATTPAGCLRAAVLGANDGILSVAGLLVGVASSGAAAADVLATGIAGLVAGAMSMAAGEYVSVQSQADTERADLALERRELHDHPQSELEELAAIYCQRGLDAALARQVAEQLTAQDALGAHARDELGITESLRARPLQAALASAAAFCCGAALPLLAASGRAARAGRSNGTGDQPDRVAWFGLDRRRGGADWRRIWPARRNPGDVLGRSGNGHQRCDRTAIQRPCLSGRDRRANLLGYCHATAPRVWAIRATWPRPLRVRPAARLSNPANHRQSRAIRPHLGVTRPSRSARSRCRRSARSLLS